MQSSNPDPCEAEEEHDVPPLQVNLIHVTPPRGKGAQLLFLEPQTACKQLKGGCCDKLRRGDHLKSLPQLLPPLALKIWLENYKNSVCGREGHYVWQLTPLSAELGVRELVKPPQ